MAVDFTTGSLLYLQPSTVLEPYRFVFSRESAVGANDGNLPYGFTPNAVTVAVYQSGAVVATAISDAMLPNDPELTVAASTVTVVLDCTYPGATGNYTLEFRFSDGTRTLPRDFATVVSQEL